jgi:heme exporter protein CcmD
MNHWHFILGAYGVTLLVVVVEILAVRARRRAAVRAAAASASSPGTRPATPVRGA